MIVALICTPTSTILCLVVFTLTLSSPNSYATYSAISCTIILMSCMNDHTIAMFFNLTLLFFGRTSLAAA